MSHTSRYVDIRALRTNLSEVQRPGAPGCAAPPRPAGIYGSQTSHAPAAQNPPSPSLACRDETLILLKGLSSRLIRRRVALIGYVAGYSRLPSLPVRELGSVCFPDW